MSTPTLTPARPPAGDPARTARTSARSSARRLSLQSLTVTPLLAGALVAGTLGAAPATTAPSPATQSAPSAAAPAARAGTAPATAPRVVTVRTRPVAYVTSPSVLRGLRAVRIAAAQKGKPYRWGASGPRAFDCSGLVYYVYKKRMHVKLPRMANAMRRKTVRISKAHARPGDLVFFMSGGRAYHVGIYAGHGKVWHSPYPGQRVKLQKIWTSHWRAGRVVT